ncbi:hypothetical protein [Bacillus taeanensis]|uniref:Spore germination protein N-terminal domain-containing protein n=1 Tax=Bacillus taeanensis TaxID=273032 RepID=A0A366XYK0_9BACI|nr:hypothetical protein [Bacillus taeanensis]RBW71232.1 hypothetical protein DS031_00315 [Bacillus taeanensis]
MNKKAGILVSFSLMLLTGCWGRQEIENIGLVVGVGIDIKEEKLEERKRPSLIFTNQFVVPGVIAGEKTGGGSADKKPFDNLTLEESTLFEGVVETSNMTSRSPSYAHLKVIMIGEDAARSVNMLQLLSFFFVIMMFAGRYI